MKKFILLLSIMVFCFAQMCPNGNLASDMFSAQVSVSPSSSTTVPNIALTSDDLYTYTYSLPLPFRRNPSVAIAIN